MTHATPLWRLFLGVLLFVGLFLGCAQKPVALAPDAGRDAGVFRVPVTVETATQSLVFQAEVADDDQERQRGLMDRQSMDPNHGMIFVFPVEEEHRFWMRNTYLELDMIFIGADRRIVGIVERAEPLTETSRGVGAPSQFVLELLGGTAAEKGIAAGQDVRFMVTIPES